MKGISGFMVLLIVGAVVVLGSQGGLFSTYPTGFTTLSLTQAQFQSSNQFFNDKLWVLTVSQGGLGQSAFGTFTKTDINSRTGQQPASDFGISINYSEQSCNYPIIRSNDLPIYKLTKIEYGCALPDSSVANQQCPNMKYYGKYPASFLCFCIDQQKITGDVSYEKIENPTVRTKSTIKVTGKSGVMDSVDIDTFGNSQGYFKGGNIFYIWNGDLFKQTCPSQSGYYAFYKDAMWRIGQASAYSDYKTRYYAVQNYVGSTSVTKEQLNNLISNSNLASDGALTEQQFADEIQGRSSLDGAIIKKTVTTPVTSPIYTFYVKADFLGIYQPVPKIVVDSGSCSPFNTYGSIQAILRNYGESGNANVWVECPSPLSFSGNNQNVFVSGGGTQVVNLPITANVGVSTTTSCTVKSNAGFIRIFGV